jgi:SAM-dependent methyltransferase
MSSLSPAFRTAYAEQRASEGRSYRGDDLLALPYLRRGPTARQWRVRARTFDAFLKHVVMPEAERTPAPLAIADLGAGNGWLSHRLARLGHRAVAVDVREDAVDGLGAAEHFLAQGSDFERVRASFDELPFAANAFDIAVFNASLHYAVDLKSVLAEAARVVRPWGVIAVLDSPFYDSDKDGAAMVAEKQAGAAVQFGERAGVLLSVQFVEYLTAERLAIASDGLSWRRRRVGYPLWYELRPLMARLNGRRRPSRFDLWVAVVR